jgi:hypothetical protein
MARLLALALLILAAVARADPADALTHQEFNALLMGLDSAMIGTRAAAEQTLTGLATQHALTAGQIASLQNLAVNGNLEEQQRAGRIFAAFVQTLPSYQTIMSLVATQQTRPIVFNDDGSVSQSGHYTFDEASGLSRTTQSIANYDLLIAGWIKVDAALRVGNVAAATTALQNLRAAIAALPANAFNTSFLAPDNGGARLNQNAVLGKIDDALNQMKAFTLDLQFFGAQNEPALPRLWASPSPASFRSANRLVFRLPGSRLPEICWSQASTARLGRPRSRRPATPFWARSSTLRPRTD